MQNRQSGGRRRRGGGGNNPRPMGMASGGQTANRLEVRVRGNAHQLLEKYKQLARDAHQAGDRVAAEYYLQHADHYFRVLNDSRIRQEEMRTRRGVFDPYEDDVQGGDEGDSDENEGVDRESGDRDSVGRDGLARDGGSRDGGDRDGARRPYREQTVDRPDRQERRPRAEARLEGRADVRSDGRADARSDGRADARLDNRDRVDGNRGDRPEREARSERTEREARPERAERQVRPERAEREVREPTDGERPRRWQERRAERARDGASEEREAEGGRLAPRDAAQSLSDGEAALVAFGGVPPRDSVSEVPLGEAPEADVPKPRRRGRPRKAEAEPIES